MTRKDYKLIANAIERYANESHHPLQDLGNVRATMRLFAKRLSADLAEENPKFNRDLFLMACGL